MILGKRLGIGLYSAALRKGMLSQHDYDLMIEITTKLNTPGSMFGCLEGVHALTDVTGFGLLGHLLEICKGSGVAAVLDCAAIPVLPKALDFASRGCVTGASSRNWAAYANDIEFDPARFGESERALLTDPQTSGGLLIACAPAVVTEVLALFLQQGFDHAAVIGEIVEGKPRISIS